MAHEHEFILTLSCPDTTGIVYAVSGLLEQQVEALMERERVDLVVLARAVRWHVEHRVLMNGHKTEVFK